jgi:hypothetical protein
LDTANNLVDKSLESQKSKVPASPSSLTAGMAGRKNQNNPGSYPGSDLLDCQHQGLTPYYGVNQTLVKLVRAALDQDGFNHVKIVVSGGFDAQKIKFFEKEKTPVDVYGVGSSLLKGSNDFTADIVKVEENLISKVGRTYFENKRMHIIKLD